jgi:ABC-2 type transport system ATP-binding protein
VTTVIQTRGLVKQFRRVTALSDCDVTVPEGRICALIGPNGAGKTTLLRLLSGLARPTAGEMSVLGSPPRQDPAFLAEVGYLAQEIPLYRRFTAEEHISIGAHLNRRWDAALVRDRLKSLKIPLDRAAGSLSGGQRAQLALTLTLAKKPRLVLLDEPVAALDPLARRHFLATMADAVAGDGLTVVLSSHLVADMERVVDHLILVGPRQDTAAIARTHTIVQAVHTPRQTTLLIRGNAPVIDPAWESSGVGLEEMVLAYMGRDAAPATSHLTSVGEEQ